MKGSFCQRIRQDRENIQCPKTYNQFIHTIRHYAERLKEEKDLSLKYLNQINELSEQLRIKNMEIEKLNKLNRQLNDKVCIYNSVISRSRGNTPLRMSTVIGSNNMTESIVEGHVQGADLTQVNPFEQFFILDLCEKEKKIIKYKYAFQSKNQILQQIINNFVDHSEGPQWELQFFGINDSHKISKSFISLFNSPFTTKKSMGSSSDLIHQLNPSFYYFLYCIVQKQIVVFQGKHCWAPVVYGFISYLPFPSYFFSLLEQIVSEITIKNGGDRKKLEDSLNAFHNRSVKLCQESRFKFINKYMEWNLPNNIQQFILSYCTDLLNKFALELIIDVLMLLLLQIPITVISSSQQTLSKFMFYFIFIIKPLKYPYPIIFNLTQKMMTLLESPFPTFIGTTHQHLVESFLSERAVFDLDNKVAKSWPMIDNLQSSRAFLLERAYKIGSFEKLSLVTGEIIKGHQYKDLEPYWKDFTRTQIYNNYVYHQ